MSPPSEPYPLHVVVCDDRNDVHLSLQRQHGPVRLETLCGLPVAALRPGTAFLADGCLLCAQVALDLGVSTAADGAGPTIDLQRYVDGRAG